MRIPGRNSRSADRPVFRRESSLKRVPFSGNVRLVAFDLDGTLVDAYRAIADSLNYALVAVGEKPRPLKEITRAVGWGVDTLINTFVDEGRAAKTLALFRAHHDKRLRQNIRLLSGAVSSLAWLEKRGVILAIASNRPEKFCRIILKQLGILPYFSHVVCGDMVRRAKPYPDILKSILKASGVKARDAVFVGDMSVDILCGRRAGVFTVGIPTGSCTRQEILDAGPDILIERLTELKEVLSI